MLIWHDLLLFIDLSRRDHGNNVRLTFAAKALLPQLHDLALPLMADRFMSYN